MSAQRPAIVTSGGETQRIPTGDTIDPAYLPAGSSAETATTIGSLINASGAATPNDTDLVATAESGGLLKKISWTNTKAFLKTYFDTLYYRSGGTDVPIVDGGTGASTAGQAATNLGLGTGDTPTFTAINIGATDTTLARSSAGNLTVQGDLLYKANGTEVAIGDGGTGASSVAGAQAALKIPRALFVYNTDVATAGTARNETLATDNIPAATMSTDKDRIDFQYNGYFEATAGEKYLYIFFNGVQRFATEVANSSGRDWEIRGRITRVSNTVVRLSFIFIVDTNSAGPNITTRDVDVSSLNLTTTAYSLAIKGNNPDFAGDIILHSGSVDYKPAP